ncbi:Bifunctional ligase/repressor BirA [bioreactor metagenome]|uniref:Bifunctional ligase/repressor BirA n=1 Tax=bioreactor metagenome TaxID=1076179 RepID=A0A645GYD4_9ZZZZ
MNLVGDFSVFAARYQTNGRGQKGNTWESAEGENLTFSILIKPKFIKAEDQFLISQITTLGIVNYLKNRGINSLIKWPNDIYVNNRKICGILIEHYLGGDKLSASIIGIGLNVNQREFASDAPNPTSMINETGTSFVIEKELELLVSSIEVLYYAADIEYYGKIMKKTEEDYLTHLYHLNEYQLYEVTGTNERFEAKITGIDKYACLVLERRNGVVKSYAFKEIRYILNL